MQFLQVVHLSTTVTQQIMRRTKQVMNPLNMGYVISLVQITVYERQMPSCKCKNVQHVSVCAIDQRMETLSIFFKHSPFFNVAQNIYD